MSLCNNFYDPAVDSIVDDKGREWILPHQLKFNTWVNRTFSQFKLSESIRDDSYEKNSQTEFPYQLFIKAFMSPGSPYRGIYIYHGLGSGKTRTSIITSEQYRALGYKLVFISPASLSSNFSKELYLWGNDDIKNIKDEKERMKYIKKFYNFVSINGTLSEKFKSIDLENKVIIIDEVHNLGSLISNFKNKKAKMFYDWLMNVKNCKIIALSGSPIINDPFELALIANILRGPMDYETSLVDARVIRNYKTVFPESKKEFEKNFIDKTTNNLKNEIIFKKRITGLFSYFYGIVGLRLPDLEIIKEDIVMSNYQYTYYKLAREYERKLDLAVSISNSGDSEPSYRNYTRQISNFIAPIESTEEQLTINELKVPEKVQKWSDEQLSKLKENFEDDEMYFLFVENLTNLTSSEEVMESLMTLKNSAEFIKTQKINRNDASSMIKYVTKRLKNIDDDIMNNLNEYSPKINKLLNNIQNGKGSKGKVFIYSHYRNYSGIGIIRELLKLQGYEEINETNGLNLNISSMSERPRYGFFVGGIKNDVRYAMKEIFNSTRNVHGEIMKIFMGTQAAAEGISLKEVQQVHVVEPYWNNVRIKQVIGRARRLGSHVNLPSDEQTVYAYMYFSVAPENTQMIETLSTDQYIYNNAEKKEDLNNKILNAVKSSSIDCSLNYAQNHLVDKDYVCYVPDPSKTQEKILWYSDLQLDLNKYEGVEYKKSFEKHKYILFPYPHHINILKLYHEQLYESKNNFYSGTVTSTENNLINFKSNMQTIKIDDYYKNYYIHFFTEKQHSKIVMQYDYKNMTMQIDDLSDEVQTGTRFWVYRPEYIAKIVNDEVYKEDEFVVLYDKKYLLTENQWIPKLKVQLTENERDAIIKSV